MLRAHQGILGHGASPVPMAGEVKRRAQTTPNPGDKVRAWLCWLNPLRPRAGGTAGSRARTPAGERGGAVEEEGSAHP